MWEADEIAQARHRIILRVYILPTHPLFPWGFFFFIKYEPKCRNRNVSFTVPLLHERTGPLSLFFL